MARRRASPDIPDVLVGVNDAHAEKGVTVSPKSIVVRAGGAAEITVACHTDPGFRCEERLVGIRNHSGLRTQPSSWLLLKGGPDGNWDGGKVWVTALQDAVTSSETYQVIFDIQSGAVFAPVRRRHPSRLTTLGSNKHYAGAKR